MTTTIVYNPFTQNFDFAGTSTSPSGPVNFLEGNTGGPVGPDGAATIHVIGSGNITVTGNAGTNTLTISELAGSITTINGDVGSVTPTAGVITLTGDSTGLTFTGVVSTMTLGGILNLAHGGTNANLTASNGGIFYSTATAGAILSGTATARQMLQSGASSAPAWSTTTWPATSTINEILYSSSANVVGGITASPNGVLISSNTNVPSWLANSGTPGFVLTANAGLPPSWKTVSASGAITSITGNSGGPEIPDPTGNFNILGTGSITVAGSLNTETIQLTGLTLNAIQVGAGTATLTQLGPTNQSVLTTGATGIPALTSLAADGQLIIGSTAGAPGAANITSTGGTITITNGSNSINLETVDGGFAWVDVNTTSATMSKNHGYEANNAGLVTLTMPTVVSSTFGDTIKIAGFGTGGFIIQCVATQLIHYGNMATSAAGSLASTNRYDQMELVCSTTTTEWFVRYSIGNFTVV